MTQRRLELSIAATLATVVLAVNPLRAAHAHGVGIGNDATQYLSTVENLLAGNGLSSSIVHFDVQYATGSLPAPMTVFPPGYPIAMAPLALAGLEASRAGLWISSLSYLLSALALVWLAELVGLTRAATALLLGLWLMSSVSWEFAAAVMTEPLFVLLSLASLGCVMTGLREAPGRRRWWMLAAGFSAAGLSFWVRYAGIFLIAALGIYFIGRLAIERSRRAFAELALLAIPGACLLALMLRNQLITGNLQGGNEKVVHNPVLRALVTLVTATEHNLLGEQFVKGDLLRPGPAELALFGGALGVACLLAVSLRGQRRIRPVRPLDAATALPALYFMVYCAGLLWLSLRTVISFGERLLYPALPVLFLLVAAVLSFVERRVRTRPRLARMLLVSIAFGFLGYAGINLRSTERQCAAVRTARSTSVEARLELPTESGESMRLWIQRHVPPDAPILAVEGQAAGHVLGRRVLSMVAAEYSAQVWDEAHTRAVMHRYRAPVFLLFPGSRLVREQLAEQSPLVRAVLEGRPPAWLTPAARSREAIAYVVRAPQ